MVLLYPPPLASTSSTVTLLLPPPCHLEIAASQWNPEDFPSPRELPADSFPFDEKVVKEITGIDSEQVEGDETEKNGAEDGEVGPDGVTNRVELVKDDQAGSNMGLEVGQAETVVKQETVPTVGLEDGELLQDAPTARTDPPEPIRTSKPNATSVPAPASSSTQLTKAHYHPKVIALAKKLAEKKGMRLLVDGTRRSMLVRYTDEKEGRTTSTSSRPSGLRGGPEDTGMVIGPSSSSSAIVPQPKPAIQDPAPIPRISTPTPTPVVEPVPATPSTPLPRTSKKKGKGRWAGHIKAHSRADTPLKHAVPAVVSSPFPVGTPGPAAGYFGGHGAAEVDVMDEAARAHWEEEVFERRRRDFGMGIGSSSWW
jgi:hypothetical protein